MLGQNASSYKCDMTVTGVTFLLVSQYESPVDDNQWLKHGAVAIRSDGLCDNRE